MARNKSVEEIEKSTAGQFAGWLYGKKDPLCGRIEMKKQEEFSETNEDVQRRIEDSKILKEKIYDMDHNRWMKVFHILYQILAAGFCLALIALLLITVSYLPSVDDAERPVNNEVSARYIESGLQETGAINIVTGMILDYRAFDTFGESNVLFVATCTVLILLRLNRNGKEKKAEEISDRLYEPKNDIILQKVAKLLVPMIIVFGIYVVLNGHLSPGGGFSGGAIIGAGLILYLNAFGFAKTERFFTEKTYKWICFSALLFYGVAKSYSFFTGANHLESGIPLGTPGAIISSGLILPLNICVGMVVACTMYAFYALFRKGGF